MEKETTRPNVPLGTGRKNLPCLPFSNVDKLRLNTKTWGANRKL